MFRGACTRKTKHYLTKVESRNGPDKLICYGDDQLLSAVLVEELRSAERAHMHACHESLFDSQTVVKAHHEGDDAMRISSVHRPCNLSYTNHVPKAVTQLVEQT